MKRAKRLLGLALVLLLVIGLVPATAITARAEDDNTALVYNWDQLYRALYKGNEITLKQDIDFGTGGSLARQNPVVPNGMAPILDLNGYTIDRKAVDGDENSVIRVREGGTLTVTDSRGGGVITGGHAVSGGGICVLTGGELILSGGTVSGNTATNAGGGVYVSGSASFTMTDGAVSDNDGGSYGGGVYADARSAFTMTRGTISGNTAAYTGGGVYGGVSCTISMLGVAFTVTGNTAGNCGGGVYLASYGSFDLRYAGINGNTAANGGGVYLADDAGLEMRGADVLNNAGGGVIQVGDSTVSLAGTVLIRGNTDAAGGDKNLCLEGGNPGCIDASSLTASRSEIGVTAPWAVGTGQPLTTGLHEDDIDAFRSDDPYCAISLNDDDQATLTWALRVGGTDVTPENRADVLGDGKVSFDPAGVLTLNGATITDNGGGENWFGIVYYGHRPLTIRARGVNRITGQAGDYLSTCGIFANKADLTVDLEGRKDTLSIQAPDASDATEGSSYGIKLDTWRDLTVTGRGSLTAAAGDAGISCRGIVVYKGTVRIERGAHVTAAGGRAGSSSCGVEGSVVCYGTLTAAGGTGTADGAWSCGIAGEDITVDGGRLTASGADMGAFADTGSQGIFFHGEMSVLGTAEVAVSAGDAGFESLGIWAFDGGVLGVYGGRLTVTAGRANTSCGVYDGAAEFYGGRVTVSTSDANAAACALYCPPLVGDLVTARGSASSDGSGAAAYDPDRNDTYKWFESVDLIMITRQPADFTGPVGGPASFSAEAEGSDGPFTYQWYYQTPDSDEWTPVSAASGKTADYSLTVKARHNGYRYYCSISGSTIIVDTRAATLTVAPVPVITADPADASVNAGGTAAFTVAAFGEDLSYQWYYRKTPSGDWTAVSAAGGRTDTYTLTAQPRHNGYQYFCQVSNACGSADSAVVTLTVLSGPVITRQPVDYTGPIGSTASFTVEASGDDLTYQWWVKTRGGSSFTKSSIKKATYSVELTEARSGNQLYCVVTDASGNSIRSDTVTMTAASALAITRQPVDYTGPIGSTASFTVEAQGDGLTYQWWVKTRGGSSFTKSSIKTAAYSVELTEARNGNQLYCVVSDSHGNSLRTNTVSMTAGAALSITAQPVGYVGAVNSMAHITVAAEGDGLSYAWFVKNPGSSDFTESSIHAATYSARLTAANSGRLLYCVVTDSHGNSLQSDTVSMSIGTPLSITAQPVSYVGAVNSQARFTVAAEGDGLSYAWFVKNPDSSDFTESSLHTATYSAKLTAANSGRLLYCVVTDSHGKSVTPDTVSMRIG